MTMTLFCYFTHSDKEVMSCFFGLNDKISSITYSSSANKVTASQEFVCPEAQTSPGNSSLISLALSPDHLHLIGVFSNKSVVCWQLLTGALVGQAVVHKKPTSLLCSTMPGAGGGGGLHFALVSDKGGEVWGYALPSLARVCKVLGHTSSVITDMALSPGGDRIVTADRDEKIRLTSFPETATIAGFCLGHTDVVTSLTFVPPAPGSPSPSSPHSSVLPSPPPLLLSSGWDHRLCLWDAEHCELLDTIELSSAASSSSSQGGGEQRDGAKEEEEEDEAAADKVYDETKAGHFPLRVVTSTSSSISSGGGFGGVFAVLFWHKPEIHIRRVGGQGGQARFLRAEGAGAGEQEEEEQHCTVISLPAAPIDCVFVEDDSNSGGSRNQGGEEDEERRALLLLVLLPAPHYLVTVTCSLDTHTAAATTGAGAAKEGGKWAAIARHFSDMAAQNGMCEFYF